MKFENLINKRFKELLEQGPAGDATFTAPEPVATSEPTQMPAAGSVTPPGEEVDKKPLTSEGEVFLVRLLKKALFLNPDDLDEKALKDLPEIDEKNASEILTQIIQIMNNYSSSLDVNIEK
jgi:hypothetical protein